MQEMTDDVKSSPVKNVSKDVVEAVNLLAQGKRNIMCGEMSHAVAQLQEACRILGAEYGELSDECADAYFWYGKALLEVARMESGVLGDAIPGDSEEDSQSSEEEAAEGDSSVSEENSEEAENDSVASEDIENEDADTANETNPAGPSDLEPSTSTGIQSQDKSNEPGKQENDDVSNLQLAWEMLELSKVIYKRHQSNDMKLKLAETYLKLGEIGLETEQYEQAVNDLSECLTIQRELLSVDDRRLAETLYQLGLACTFDRQYDDAVTHYRSAIEVLENKISSLRRIVSGETVENPSAVDIGSFESPAELAQKEIDELSSIVPDLVAKIEDIEDERRSAPQVQWMMKEAVPATGDPMSRLGCSDSGFASSSSSGFTSSSSSSTAFQSFSDSSASSSQPQPVVHNITHLVRKKRKSDVDDVNADVVKKVKVATDNGHSVSSDATPDSSDNGHLAAETVKLVNGDAGESVQG